MHHFLKKKELNELYLSYGLLNFALGLVSVFVPIYLFTIGYSVAWILGYFFLHSLGFVLLSYLGARLVSWLGVKHSILLSAAMLIVYFVGLKQLSAWPGLFFVLPFWRALEIMLYNYSFHLNFLRHSDRQRHGRAVVVEQAIALVASIIAPFLGGLLAKFFGFDSLFAIGLAVIAASVVPLFFSPESYERLAFDKRNLYRGLWSLRERPLFLSYAGYAIESWIGMILWPLFLMLLVNDTGKLGALVALPGLLTLVVFYFFGRLADRADKGRLLAIGSILHFFGWLGRLFVQGFDSTFLVDSYKRLSERFVQIPWSAMFYDLASDGNYFKMIVQREMALHLTRLLALPPLILLFAWKPGAYVAAFVFAALASLLYPAMAKVRATKTETTLVRQEGVD